ncbi:MAG: ATP-dependent zinc protease [Bdellovibrionota bacterium]|jgi:hypothetical protein
MSRSSLKSLLFFSFILAFIPLQIAIAQEKEVVGYIEKVRLHPEKILAHAKLDTGADISALNAEDIVEYKKDGVPWVRFTIRNRFGEQFRLEREIKRTTRIKQHNRPSQKRYVIRLGICLGSAYMEEEVSLVNRSQFTSQMLVGRSFLAGNVIIDPAQTYMVEPTCRKSPSKTEVKKVKKNKKVEDTQKQEGQSVKKVEEKIIEKEK